MGREVRKVPADWQHPIDSRTGRFKPMHAESYDQAAEDYLENCILWASGKHPDQIKHKPIASKYYWEWEGNPPDSEYYAPEIPEDQKTHFMMYETTSEGTPISPAFATPELLARWLSGNGASAFGDQTASYEGWLRICRGGYAPDMVSDGGQMQSGVEAFKELKI